MHTFCKKKNAKNTISKYILLKKKSCYDTVKEVDIFNKTITTHFLKIFCWGKGKIALL